ncbi:MAG TPA: hypothetical protein VJI12_04105 [archaeon]|nr:hypothetical protein [archaeon]
MGKIFILIGIILALVGLGYVFMPNALPSMGFEGFMQTGVGVVLVLIGLAVIWKKH